MLIGSSSSRLLLALPPLQEVLHEAAKTVDILVMDSMRGRAAQELAFKRKVSKVHFGDSAHNYKPAVALDVAPWTKLPGSSKFGVDWSDKTGVPKFARLQLEIILPLAKKIIVPLVKGQRAVRQGIDWNGNGNIKDDGWDSPHIELHPWREWARRFCRLYEGD